DRMTATGGAAFTTAVRVVDRVHDDAAVMRGLAAPAGATGLAVVDVAVIRVGYGADRREAGRVNQALFAGVQAKDRHALVAADELDEGAGGAGDLAALARLHLDVMNNRANRDVLQRHGVAGLDVNGLVG